MARRTAYLLLDVLQKVKKGSKTKAASPKPPRSVDSKSVETATTTTTESSQIVPVERPSESSIVKGFALFSAALMSLSICLLFGCFTLLVLVFKMNLF